MSLQEPEPNPFSSYDDMQAKMARQEAEIAAQHQIILRLYKMVDALTDSNELLRSRLSSPTASVCDGGESDQRGDTSLDVSRILTMQPPNSDS